MKESHERKRERKGDQEKEEGRRRRSREGVTYEKQANKRADK